MSVELEKFSPEMNSSYERLCLLFHVHNCNSELLNNTIELAENLENHPGKTMDPETLHDWLSAAGFVMQTIDALVHILQKEHIGPALEMAQKLTDEDKIFIRDNFKSPGIDRMLAILEESEEDRTQRMLLEHLGIHE